MENVKEWIIGNIDSHGDGYGCGSGHGNGYGYGDGSGDGSGYGSGDGSGHGGGYGDGSGDGSGHGSGDGYGCGSGHGNGYGYGRGDSRNIYSINGSRICYIDGIATSITKTKNNIAKGFIVNCDFTARPCYVAKGNNLFAHGKTVREAVQELHEKIFSKMDVEETIRMFLKEFKQNKKYSGHKFFEWHNYLTGSCLMGRESFVRNHGFDLDKKYSVEEFFDACIHEYGGEIIKQLKNEWGKSDRRQD